jgi:hypothetical protein
MSKARRATGMATTTERRAAVASMGTELPITTTARPGRTGYNERSPNNSFTDNGTAYGEIGANGHINGVSGSNGVNGNEAAYAVTPATSLPACDRRGISAAAAACGNSRLVAVHHSGAELGPGLGPAYMPDPLRALAAGCRPVREVSGACSTPLILSRNFECSGACAGNP